MLIQRLTPEAFKAKYLRQGWNGKVLITHCMVEFFKYE